MQEKITFDSLSDELKAKLTKCKTQEELKKVLTDAGMALDEDVLQAVAGGIGTTDLQSAIYNHDSCLQDFCRLDSNKPFCPSHCPKKSQT